MAGGKSKLHLLLVHTSNDYLKDRVIMLWLAILTLDPTENMMVKKIVRYFL